MERLTKWWRSRQLARVSTDKNEFSRSGLRFVVAFFALLFLLLVVWGLLLGGRWVYSKFDGKPADSSQTQQNEDKKDSPGLDIDGETASPEEEAEDEPTTPTPSPAPSPSPSPTPTPTSPEPTVPTRVPRTGPEE